MNDANQWVLLIAGAGLALCALSYLYQRFFPNARDIRKRSRNYGKVVSRARRPVVMLNARVPRD
jgi:hypothetical protein